VSHRGVDDRNTTVSEFERAAPHFSARTRGRYADLDPVGFSRVTPGSKVLEVGAGTGVFLALFEETASLLAAVDLTPAMLRQAVDEHSSLSPVVADGVRLPIRSQSFDLVTSALTIHHVTDPIGVVREMRRVVRAAGSVLIVDQTAPERYEAAVAMTALELLRDPSHAISRPPSGYRTMVQAVGLEVVDERFSETSDRLSSWMSSPEFPEARIEAVRTWLDEHATETGMDWDRDGDDWVYTRRRMALLARRPEASL
jgi:ubiquinone/menaquinone biosynthesis C-methylase UbiE